MHSRPKRQISDSIAASSGEGLEFDSIYDKDQIEEMVNRSQQSRGFGMSNFQLYLEQQMILKTEDSDDDYLNI